MGGKQSGSATTVFARKVEPEQHVKCEEWLNSVSRATSDFDGYRGTTILRPATDQEEYVAIVQFDGCTENSSFPYTRQPCCDYVRFHDRSRLNSYRRCMSANDPERTSRVVGVASKNESQLLPRIASVRSILNCSDD